jgi:hypothetical protein
LLAPQTATTALLTSEAESSQPRENRTRDRSGERRSARVNSVKNGGRERGHASSREDSDEDMMRPAKYVRLVDRKLTRVRYKNVFKTQLQMTCIAIHFI